MTIRTAPEPPRYDATVQRSVKNFYDRDPVLIPQLFEEGGKAWYRRSAGLVLALLALLALSAVGLVVYRYGLGGTVERVGRLATGMFRTFARIAG
jgi:hypothetical protein